MSASIRPESLEPVSAVAVDSPLIVRLLQTIDRLDPEKLGALWDAQSRSDVTLEQSVISAGLADEHAIAQAYAKHYLLPLFDPPADLPLPIDLEVGRLLPVEVCRRHLIAPLADDGHTLDVAIVAPESLRVADLLKRLTGRQMRPLFAPRAVVQRSLQLLYGADATVDELDLGAVDKAGAGSLPGGADEWPDFAAVDDEEIAASGSPATASCGEVRQTAVPAAEDGAAPYIHALFEQALQMGASDIHLEPHGDGCRLRTRVRGRLSEITPPPMAMLPAIVARLKSLAQLDPSEQHLPQDGVLRLRGSGDRFDVRVSTLPTVQGEKVVMRLREQSAEAHDLRRLGLDDRQRRDLIAALREPHGLVLVTGPAGSGKTTTLYSCLSYLNDAHTNLCSVEDPVESRLAGIHQLQIRPTKGLTFVSALRTVLRQDPDAVMVGELGDRETTALSLRAVREGHRLLSALPTADAPASVAHLRQWGVEPAALAGTLRLLVAQRLVRRLCTHCREPYAVDAMVAQQHRIPADVTLYRAAGCDRCHHRGYRGQLAVFEVVPVAQPIARWLQRGGPRDLWRQVAIEAGIKRLRQSVRDKVVQGVTSLEEAAAAIGGRAVDNRGPQPVG